MRLERLQAIADDGVALDTETHQIQNGLLAPPIVCGSVALINLDVFEAHELASHLEAEGRSVEAHNVRVGTEGREGIESDILTKDAVLELFLQLLRDPTKIIVGANIAFDLLVLANEWAKKGFDCIPLIFRAFQEQRIFDLQIAEALHAIANGHLNDDPRTGKPLVNAITKKKALYSLAMVTDLVLGRTDAKKNDYWRQRYAELEHIPIEQWPEEAREYPKDDTRNTIEVAAAQCGHLPKTTPHHEWGKDGCEVCGATRFGEMCIAKKPHRNLYDHANQVWTAFCLHLGAAWGFHVDQSKVDVIEKYAVKKRAAGITPFIEAGVIRPEGSVNQGVLKKLVAKAYGASSPCELCSGTGKRLAPNPRTLVCTMCKGRSAPWKGGGQIKAPTVDACSWCDSTGRVVDVRHRVTCRGDDGSVTCDGTGLELADTMPRSDTGLVPMSADTCFLSGDEFVMSYGHFTADGKWLKDYIPYLRKARREFTPGCGKWFDIPLTLQPNAILETGRVSYRGYIQLFPRWPGFYDKADPAYQSWEVGGRTGSKPAYVPSFREAIVARPGYVLSSEDFRAGELVTHAQSCKWLVGFSDLGDVLLSKDSKGKPMDPHSMLASTVLGVPYEELIAALKSNRRFSDARQGSKIFNFGKPGGMGDAKIVLTSRKGVDTPHETGPVWVNDEDGNLVRGYKGQRLCLLMGGDGPCGQRMVYEHKGKPTAPICGECLDRAIELSAKWKQQWRESKPYFDLASRCVEEGQVITFDMLERWPHLQDFFEAGHQLAAGEIMQHVSGRVRGGLNFMAAANGWFQGLLADVTKAALRRISWECYDRSIRVPSQLYANSVPSRYAGIVSPLFGSRPIVFQHDEVILEHRLDMGHDGATRTSEIMVDELRHYCPDLADACSAEPTLMKSWHKGASPVWARGGSKPADVNDRLIPWEPL